LKPRILFILHLPPPIHGAAMVGQYIQQSSVINESFCCDFINLSTSNHLNEIGKGGLKKLYALINIQVKILVKLLSNNYDLCYMTLSSSTPGFYKDLFVVIILKFFGKKVVYHFHNKGVERCSKSGLNRFLYGFALKKTQIILLSPYLYKDIAQFVHKENVYYCANGIPIVSINDKDNEIQAKCDPVVRLLFLSNMMLEKGVWTLLEACKILKDRKCNFECHFVGPWSNITEQDFTITVIKYELTGFVFAHGKKYDKDKIEFFKTSDIFILPTYNECFPLVLLEAMQYGLPTISTFEGGIPGIIVDTKTGFIVKQKDVSGLADKIELLVKDKNLRLQMGLQGKEKFHELFTIQTFENNLNNILKQIVDGSLEKVENQ
jgi:glycosyltransferase involved in cell wall biosynthesis